ncbi:MAG TPA: IS3 family transposase [Casimicrobiaceae bacterium]|nr:IS3 family transposase [Casimicrobiaceae bacterium]
MTSPKSNDVEVLGAERRRRWSTQEKLAIVRETYEPGMSVSLVARKHGVNPNQLFHWRKLERIGALTAVGCGETVVPAAELDAARRQIRELQRLLGKKTLEVEILKEAVEGGPRPKMDCALALVARGQPMKLVADVLGVARSNLHRRARRSATWRDSRRHRTPRTDSALVSEIQHEIAQLTAYGYRRAWVMVNRRRDSDGRRRVNHKRVYRVMREHRLLLQRHTARPVDTRSHDGRIAVDESNRRWCSDGFEIACDNRERVRVAFALDCCDREAMSWIATTRGITGDMVRDLMVEAVEARFGDALPAHPIEWLSDNGSPYVARPTRAFARDIGLEPVTTALRSPQSNGMAEAFVKTFKRDYVQRMDRATALSVLQQLRPAFEHYNEVHPHSALKMLSPRMFRERRRHLSDKVCPQI